MKSKKRATTTSTWHRKKTKTTTTTTTTTRNEYHPPPTLPKPSPHPSWGHGQLGEFTSTQKKRKNAQSESVPKKKKKKPQKATIGKKKKEKNPHMQRSLLVPPLPVRNPVPRQEPEKKGCTVATRSAYHWGRENKRNTQEVWEGKSQGQSSMYCVNERTKKHPQNPTLCEK